MEIDLYQAALLYVSRYATSSENLKRVLLRRMQKIAFKDGVRFSEADYNTEIERIIQKLSEKGILNDQELANGQARHLRERGHSERSIRGKLSAKGLSDHHIESALQSLVSEFNDNDAIAAYASRRKLGPFRPRELQETYRKKDLAALCRAGFDYDLVRSFIDGR